MVLICELFLTVIFLPQNDIARKPQGHIRLDGQTRITKSDSAQTFEVRIYIIFTVCQTLH